MYQLLVLYHQSPRRCDSPQRHSNVISTMWIRNLGPYSICRVHHRDIVGKVTQRLDCSEILRSLKSPASDQYNILFQVNKHGSHPATIAWLAATAPYAKIFVKCNGMPSSSPRMPSLRLNFLCGSLTSLPRQGSTQIQIDV